MQDRLHNDANHWHTVLATVKKGNSFAAELAGRAVANLYVAAELAGELWAILYAFCISRAPFWKQEAGLSQETL